MVYEMDDLTRTLLRARERDMRSILGRELYQTPQRYVPPESLPLANVFDSSDMTASLLALQAQRRKSITDVTIAALMSKPPKANIVRVSEDTDSDGNQEFTVRYDRFSTAEKFGIAVGVGVLGVAAVTVAAILGGAYVAGKAIEASSKKDER